MLDREKLKEFAESWLAARDYFLVDAKVSGDNDAVLEIENVQGPVDIDVCEALSRAVYEEFDREAEDYSLEVGSAGLTSPFKVPGQYRKALGHDVEVLAADGRKHRGTLREAGEEEFTVLEPEKVKVEGKKRPETVMTPHTYRYDNVKYTKYYLDF